ncbi:MAG: hypothetical protein JST83_06655 [Bacteroidetes bacterium]|nr:hypothetical protein [Bacteroidota bacterium]
MKFQDSNLYQLFSSLSPSEMKDMDKALHSPFFNYREEEIRLYDYLCHGRKKSTEPTAAEAYLHVFGKKKTDLAKLRHVMTYLTRILTRYITIHEMEQAEEERRLLLARALRRRGLEKQFLASYSDTQQYYDTAAPLSPGLYYHQLQLHTEHYIHSITNRRAQNEGMARLSDDLDALYMVHRLKHACNILSYRTIFKSDREAVPPIEMNDAERQRLLADPLAAMLYHNYLCLREPNNEDYFAALKKLLLTTSARIDPRELRDAFTLAINYCIRRLNTGGQKYYVEVFELYEAGLSRQVFEENNYLSAFTYKNIAAIAIGLKKYDWVAAFLEEYKSRLAPDIREGFYAYCMARYYFARGRYADVSALLQQVDIREQFTDLDARVLLIKTYYEQDEYNLMDYTISNMKQQLKRKDLQTYHQSIYGNFLRSAGRLMHLRPYDKKAKAALRDKIAATTAIAEKEWLLSKV